MRLLCALTLTAMLLPAHATETQVRIDTPRGGWRSGVGDGSSFTQPVQYPAAIVSSPGDQDDSARIRGHIAAAAVKNPALLVVNGVAMPLRVEEDGSFDRPYLFPSGSNSVEVRDGERAASQRVQFLSDGKGQVPARLRVLLAWDSDNTDLDLHVVTPDGAHVFYANRVAPNGGALDVDVTTGFGPEIYASPTPLTGTHLVYVNYFGGSQEMDEDGNGAITTASVTIISQEGTANEKIETFQVPLRAAGELTLVKRFSYP